MRSAGRAPPPLIRLRVDGADVEVADEGATLLTVLREQLRLHDVKDGCSPQGQCGCCTVWVDGAPRVSCVTPIRRVAGRSVTTPAGLEPDTRDRWGDALCASGGSQCGFCTPGIVMRLAAVVGAGRGPDGAVDTEALDARVDQALLAHLCRCTGWQTVREAAELVAAAGTGVVGDDPTRDLEAAARRATVEGRNPQRVGPGVALGDAGFADDLAPADALVAVPDPSGGYAVGATLAEARSRSGRVQGRNTTVPLTHPLEVPDGPWVRTLRTTWVEPAYLEPDASWCAPGGEPASPLGNGGAFGGKRTSPVAADARRLADELGRPVRVVWSREDVVRRGPKRPPLAGGVDATGAGRLRVGVGDPASLDPGAWDALCARVAAVAPGLDLEPVATTGPAVSFEVRAAVWAEAAALVAPGEAPTATVTSPDGATATVTVADDAALTVVVDAGAPLDATVLRSYAIGAVHQGLGLVLAEGIAVDGRGDVADLTIRSFGILPARAMPPVAVEVVAGTGPPVNGAAAVFAATTAAAWRSRGCPPAWPVDRDGLGPRGGAR